jgi:hypothetical protein
MGLFSKKTKPVVEEKIRTVVSVYPGQNIEDFTEIDSEEEFYDDTDVEATEDMKMIEPEVAVSLIRTIFKELFG